MAPRNSNTNILFSIRPSLSDLSSFSSIMHIISHHYAQRRLKYTEILQHDVSKTGRGVSDFIFHIYLPKKSTLKWRKSQIVQVKQSPFVTKTHRPFWLRQELWVSQCLSVCMGQACLNLHLSLSVLSWVCLSSLQALLLTDV